MKTKDILTAEKQRKPEDMYKIYFYSVGNWWRAYEWSAYLCNIFPNGLDEKNRLTITHRNDKSGDYVFVGLQSASFDKYLPMAMKDLNVGINDESFSVDVSAFIKDKNIQVYFPEELSQWKESIPIKVENNINSETNDKKKPIIVHNDGNKQIPNPTVMEILQDIMYYPLGNKTPMDNIEFIGNIKNKIIRIFI